MAQIYESETMKGSAGKHLEIRNSLFVTKLLTLNMNV